jgi:hypothetical protein
MEKIKSTQLYLNCFYPFNHPNRAFFRILIKTIDEGKFTAKNTLLWNYDPTQVPKVTFQLSLLLGEREPELTESIGDEIVATKARLGRNLRL